MKSRRTMKITGRISSVTNSFVQAIIPDCKISKEHENEILLILDMSDGKKCVYCEQPATDWDHLRPLVRNKRPTGYLNEPQNMVPACGPCNQSKGGSDWHEWINSKAKGSPKTKGVPNIDKLIARLKKFEAWGNVQPYSFEEKIPSELMDNYWKLLEEIEDKMKAAQIEAAKIKEYLTK